MFDSLIYQGLLKIPAFLIITGSQGDDPAMHGLVAGKLQGQFIFPRKRTSFPDSSPATLYHNDGF
jgi:hypothetical protein